MDFALFDFRTGQYETVTRPGAMAHIFHTLKGPLGALAHLQKVMANERQQRIEAPCGGSQT